MEVDSNNNLWSIVWKTFENASLTYDLALSGNGTKIQNIDENIFFKSLTPLEIITGLLIAWIAEIRLLPIKLEHSIEKILKGVISLIINVSCFVLFAPIIASILTCFFIYRRIVHIILKITMKDEYAGLLEGLDCVWTVEDTSALSVINILAILELNDDNSSSMTDYTHILDDFRNLIKSRLLTSNLDKLFWLKEKKYGYYYWRKSDYVNLEERVRLLNDDDDSNDYNECDGTCEHMSKEYLRRIITKVNNKPLPQNHSICWEILIAKNCIKSISHNCSLKKKIPLIFRVHHALGDGVALLRLLLEEFADKKDININSCKNEYSRKNRQIINEFKNENRYCEINENNVRLPILQRSSSLYGNFHVSSDIAYYSSHILGASMPFSKIIWLQSMFRLVKNNLELLGRKIIAFISIPSCLYYQGLKSMDKSALHGPALTGDKIISCWIEDEYKRSDDYGLLAKIRDIKNITGTRFGDVVLAALSTNLNNYFLQNGKESPKTMSVVIPIRMTIPSSKLTLKNRFSVGLLPLCISEIDDACGNYQVDESAKILDRLRNVTALSDKLKRDPDYIINYWVMKWLCAALPEYFIRPFLQSNSTMIFSNLPGPQNVTLMGHSLKKIAFWIPHRGTTGIGFSFLSYGGSINLSVIADKAVMNDEDALYEILKGTVRDIEQLHENINRSCFKI